MDPYRRIARFFDCCAGPFLRGLRTEALRLYPPAPGMAVLDIGCGTGTQLALYRRAGCRISGIDTSPAMLEIARRKLGEEAALHLGSAEKMPWPVGTFDLILLTLSLHELPVAVRDTIVEEAKRVLTPNGRILITEFHPASRLFPAGWIHRAPIAIGEFLAGRDHFTHYRAFLRAGGVPPLSARHALTMEKQQILRAGNVGLFLLRRG